MTVETARAGESHRLASTRVVLRAGCEHACTELTTRFGHLPDSMRTFYACDVVFELRGVELPGRRFECFDGVQVGMRVGTDVLDLVAADAGHARWETEVRVRETDRGYDFAGPAVRGRRGERALALAWLNASGELFRAAKLRLDRVPAAAIADALSSGGRLVATIRLTDDRGGPLCATVPESHVTWERC